jgi:hypothetical protein
LLGDAAVSIPRSATRQYDRGGAAEKREIACLTSALPHCGQACSFSRSA